MMQGRVPKPGTMKSLVWTYFGFIVGADGQSCIIIHMKYYSFCVDMKVSFNIGIFSCIKIFWLRIYRIMQK